MLLIDKYSPKSIDDIIENEKLKRFFSVLPELNKIPNIIIKGSRGCGKSKFINLFLEEIKGYKIFKLNNNDIRDIEKMKTITSRYGKKIILIDNCFNLELSIQQLLNIIIDSSSNCSFIIITNNVNNIMDTLKNKIFVLTYQNIPIDTMFNYFSDICNKEKINIDDAKLKKIIKYAENDFRAIFNNITIHENIDYSYEDILIEIINSKDLNNNIKLIIKLFDDGYTLNNIVNKMNIIIKDIDDFERKITLIEIISEIFIRNNEGLDTLTQLLCLITRITNN